jgi:hypothetical protein
MEHEIHRTSQLLTQLENEEKKLQPLCDHIAPKLTTVHQQRNPSQQLIPSFERDLKAKDFRIIFSSKFNNNIYFIFMIHLAPSNSKGLTKYSAESNAMRKLN